MRMEVIGRLLIDFVEIINVIVWGGGIKFIRFLLIKSIRVI
jgi:hypothetical protein